MNPLFKHMINVLGVIGRVIQTSEQDLQIMKNSFNVLKFRSIAPVKLCRKAVCVNRGSGPNWQEYLPWLDVICKSCADSASLAEPCCPRLPRLRTSMNRPKFSVDGSGCSAPVAGVSEMDGLVVKLSSSLLCLLHAPPSPQLFNY